MSGPHHTQEGHEFEATIDQLAEMIDGAKRMAEAGQIVELDVLAMKIAVLTDAIADNAAGRRPSPFLPKLEQLMRSLDQLEITLRKRNVNLALDLQQADRRLRAQLAYGGDKTGH
ncbi:MAG TPA: hypothetical protein VMT54_20200 [Candidatus Cybelea sp.]|nr:hypothetical protein [Candidatus Cybelea sp.]